MSLRDGARCHSISFVVLRNARRIQRGDFIPGKIGYNDTQGKACVCFAHLASQPFEEQRCRLMSVSPDSLVTEVELLRNRVVELEAQLLARADASGVIARLRERVKELSTLYRESYLADQTRSTPEDYFYEIVALLPPGWQYPEDCCARLLVNGQTYATPNFVESAWQQSCTVVVQGREIGMVTVAYLSAHPPADEGPFLAEERSLINEIAKRIGQFIERRQTETARRHLAAIVESTGNP